VSVPLAFDEGLEGSSDVGNDHMSVWKLMLAHTAVK
jgi:hypothetical protein